MIWTDEDVREVRALSMWQIFDELMLTRMARPERQEQFVKDRMFREFRNALWGRFLEAAPDDVLVVSMPGPVTSLPCVHVRIDWDPGARPVELVGGSAHGCGRDVGALNPRDHPTIRVPAARPRPAVFEQHPTSPLYLFCTYKAWGWNPETRSWVYTYEGTT